MSKCETRLLIIGQLRLKSDSVLWDIGAGTGTIPIETGLLCPKGKIVAIERDEDVAGLIAKNCQKFGVNNGGAIPPNLLAIPNTESNSYYLRYCRERDIKPHPARFPAKLPEYFIRMLTDKDNFVFDPFGGSCVTGEVSERLQRSWLCPLG